MDHRRVADIATRQHGVITRVQALETGVTSEEIRQRVTAGAWHRLHEGVFGIAGARVTYESRLIAACLAAGSDAVASHRAAAIQHELLRYRDKPLEITTGRIRSPERRGVIVHRLADLHHRWVVRIDAVPMTTVARTLVDLGAVASLKTVEAALDRAVGRRLVTYRDVRDAMLAVARQGRRGVGTIRRLLDARIGEVIPAGVFEAVMASVLRRTGLPHAEREYLVVDEHGGFVAVVDFAYPMRRLALEVDGYEFHSTPRALATRNVRDRLLADADWLPLHFSWEEVQRRPDAVAAEIRRHFSARSLLPSNTERAENP